MIAVVMENALIESLVRRYWPEECDAIGESVVSDVVRGDHELTSVQGASYVNLAEIIKAVADAVVTIKTILEIQQLLRNKLGRPPGDVELESGVSQRKVGADDPDKTHLIILDLSGPVQPAQR
jgi:hypothetical protein